MGNSFIGGISGDVSNTTFGTSATISGITAGIFGASKMTTKLSDVQTSERDSLLRSLEKLNQDVPVPDFCLELMAQGDENQNGKALAGSTVSIAGTVGKSILTPVSLATHSIQTVSDLSIGVEALTQAIRAHSKPDSTVTVEQKSGESAHAKMVSDAASDMAGEGNDHIEDQLKMDINYQDDLHAVLNSSDHTVHTGLAKGTALASASLPFATVAGIAASIDAIGNTVQASNMLSHNALAIPLSTVKAIDQLLLCSRLMQAALRDPQLILSVADSGCSATTHAFAESNSLADCTASTGALIDSAVVTFMSVMVTLLQNILSGFANTLSATEKATLLSVNPAIARAFSILDTQALSHSSDQASTQRSEIIMTSTGVNLSSVTFSSTFSAERQKVIDQRIDQLNMLGDDEDMEGVVDNDDLLTIRGFYKILIETFAQQDTGINKRIKDKHYDNPQAQKDAFTEELLTRFDRGGITLSRFHSDHGALLLLDLMEKEAKAKEKSENVFMKNDQFVGCDDARDLLQKVVDETLRARHTGNYVLLRALHAAISTKPVSKRVEAAWNNILNTIDRYQAGVLANKQKVEGKKPEGLFFDRSEFELAKPAVQARAEVRLG